MKQSDQDDVHWEIDGGGNGASDALGATGRLPKRKSRSGVAAITVVVGAISLLLIYLVYTRWQLAVVEQHITAVVREDDRSFQRDNAGVVASPSEPTDPMASGANPDPGLERDPSDDSPAVTIASATTNSAQVLVTRRFRNADGVIFLYNFAQFYSLDGGNWKRIPPPLDYWGDKGNYYGARLGVDFWEPDREMVEGHVGPYVDALLVRLCEIQACPPGLFPWRLQYRRNDRGDQASSYVPGATVVDSPQLAGFPVGEQSQERYLNGVSGLVYSQIANQMYLLESGEPDIQRILLVGGCIGAFDGKPDVSSCSEAGIER